MSTEVFLFLNALSRSLLLFLVASGLTLVFGLMGVVNFAHGAFYMLGGYFAIALLGLSESFWIALLIAPILVAIVGVVLEYYTFKPLYGQDPIIQVLLTFGLAIVLEETVMLIWGVNAIRLAGPEMLTGAVPILGINYPAYRLFVIVIGSAVAIALFLLIERTRYGLIIKAGTIDDIMVETLGINIDRVFTIMFGLGVALAGVGGVITGPLTSVYPAMGIEIIILAFIVVVVGGIGSLTGSLVGALIVGSVSTIGGFYAGAWVNPILYSILVLTLIVRPTGMFGEEGGLE